MAARDGLARLPDRSIHTVITSPPYWGLRDYEVDGQLGLEDTVDAYVQELVEVFQGVKRVLRDDGTAWLVLGDSFIAAGEEHGQFKRKDLALVPSRVAIALHDAGWYIRQKVTWVKGMSGEKRMGACMPEPAMDRPICGTEDIYLLTKNPDYYYDHIGVREPLLQEEAQGMEFGGQKHQDRHRFSNREYKAKNQLGGGNLRNAWYAQTARYPGTHFAVFPETLPRLAIQASTSDHGACSACGTPYNRVTEKEATGKPRSGVSTRRTAGYTDIDRDDWQEGVTYATTGWEPGCGCNRPDTVPCTVLDPFLGSGTTALTAITMGRRAIGIDLNSTYCDMAKQRLMNVPVRLDAFQGP